MTLSEQLYLYNKIKNMSEYQDDETQMLLDEVIDLTNKELKLYD